MPEKKKNTCVDCGNPCSRRAKRCGRCKMLKLHKDNPDLINKMNKARMKKENWREETSRKVKEFFSVPQNLQKHREALHRYYIQSSRRLGDKAPNWQGGLSDKNNILRGSKEYEDWRKAVFIRDNFTCQDCCDNSNKLHAHHIVEWSKDESKRFDVDDGITLCQSCHSKIHKRHIRNKPNL